MFTLNKQWTAFALIWIMIGTIYFSAFAAAQTTHRAFSGSSTGAGYTKYNTQPSWQTYYGADRIKTYWPQLGDKETCEAREDLILQVAPGGCEPMVVRSDLIAEQNVPVFCQLDAVKINPLIDIEQIRNIRFTGDRPMEIIDFGFHPARAALRTHDKLLGSPLVNNIGYVVVVLKRQPDESKLPDFVNVTITAQVDYIAGNVYGVGKADFVLEPSASEDNWEQDKLKQSFWNGRYFVRLEEVDDNFATVSVYNGDRKVITQRVEKGKTSNKVFMPGMYCRAGLEIAYDGFVSADDSARIEVSSAGGTDSFDVYKGSRFIDGRCSVSKIEIDKNGETGKVSISCSGKRIELEIKPKVSSVLEVDDETRIPTEKDGEYTVDLGKNGTYLLKANNELYKAASAGQNVLLVNANGEVQNENLGGLDRDFVLQVYNALKDFRQRGSVGLKDNREGVDKTALEWYDKAVETLEGVADDFPDVKESDADGAEIFGAEALKKGIDLSGAGKFNMEETKARLLNKYIELYGEEDLTWADAYSRELEELYSVDVSKSGDAVEVNERTWSIRLVSLNQESEKQSARFYFGNSPVEVEKDKTVDLRDSSGIVHGNLTLESVDAESVRVVTYCSEDGKTKAGTRKSYTFRLDREGQEICSIPVNLNDINAKESAKIRLLPFSEGTQTESNFTVNIGIEKRAIQLSPDKTKERIKNLNETIEKWENILDSLENVIKGMKGACFATAGILSFKNFFSGLSGEAIARQQVMNGENGWKNICKKMVEEGKYTSLEQCYVGESGKIDSDVGLYTKAIGEVNNKINEIHSKHPVDSGGLLESGAVDTDAVRSDLRNEILKECQGVGDVNLEGKKWYEGTNELGAVGVDKIVSSDNVNVGRISTDEMRRILTNCIMKKEEGLSSQMGDNIDSGMKEIALGVNSDMVLDAQFEAAKGDTKWGGVVGGSESTSSYIPGEVHKITTGEQAELGLSDIEKNQITHSIRYVSSAKEIPDTFGGGNIEAGTYIIGLQQRDAAAGTYVTSKVWKLQGDTPVAVEKPSAFLSASDLSRTIKDVDNLNYINEIAPSDRLVRYYETEPYKGMPAVVPFDVREGWYAATKQTLPIGGGIGAFDNSGRVVSFWLCNVGENNQIEIDTGYGDDLCQRIDLTTGQPLGTFPGLDTSKARDLITKAQRAIEDAARQYGQGKYVNVLGERLEVGLPSVGVPTTSCQDFMSPKECLLLFNVCDPVICPSSRCDLGGKYPVADVIQTGIVGSIFLCLPNIQEGIAIPVCLSGVHAGIEGLVSIMRNHRDCLQYSLETGEMVGVCDEIYSIYMCEFLWKQFGPIVNILIPKLVELAYGQGVRGGAEYLTVQSAWKNTENSIDYFTQSYAVNSLEAFQARSIEEAGTPICKAFISVKAPTDFETLIEPDSPPQFHAWFDSTTYTTATVPATAQYKVFYHIFAGNDQGVHFNVYLKSPPESSYYSIAGVVPVGSGFIAPGEYASQTEDFTAPEGYKELCVRINDEEKCGFKQVSTSFAINYLRDAYVNSEIERTDIKSESECISGGRNVGSLLNPNLQAGVEETINPEIYNRGVIRICGTENPGSGVEPSRWVNVGYCDDTKIKCWLDKRSVENAITDSNVGLKNATLSELEKVQLDGQIIPADEVNGFMLEIENELIGLGRLDKSDVAAGGLKVLTKIEELEEKLWYNSHKARLMLLKGQVYAVVAQKLLEGEKIGGASSGGDGSGDEEVLPERILDRAVVKYLEDDDRIVADIESSGGYSLNSDGELEWWDGSVWRNVDDDTDEWKVKLKGELIESRDSLSGGGFALGNEIDECGFFCSKTKCEELRGEWVDEGLTGIYGKCYESDSATGGSDDTPVVEEETVYYDISNEGEITLGGEPLLIIIEGNFVKAGSDNCEVGTLVNSARINIVSEKVEACTLDDNIKGHLNILDDKFISQLNGEVINDEGEIVS